MLESVVDENAGVAEEATTCSDWDIPLTEVKLAAAGVTPPITTPFNVPEVAWTAATVGFGYVPLRSPPAGPLGVPPPPPPPPGPPPVPV